MGAISCKRCGTVYPSQVVSGETEACYKCLEKSALTHVQRRSETR